jgi:hypothetical protein
VFLNSEKSPNQVSNPRPVNVWVLLLTTGPSPVPGMTFCCEMAAVAAKWCTEEGVNQWASRRLYIVRFAQHHVHMCPQFRFPRVKRARSGAGAWRVSGSNTREASQERRWRLARLRLKQPGGKARVGGLGLGFRV